MKIIGVLAITLFSCLSLLARQQFNGIDVNMGNIYRLSDAKSRSISPENFNGEKRKGGMATTGNWRFSILRFYWDDEKEPSVVFWYQLEPPVKFPALPEKNKLEVN